MVRLSRIPAVRVLGQMLVHRGEVRRYNCELQSAADKGTQPEGRSASRQKRFFFTFGQRAALNGSRRLISITGPLSTFLESRFVDIACGEA